MRFEEIEIRTSNEYPDPFPLYPYEEIIESAKPFIFLKDNEALILKANMPFVDERDPAHKVERYIEDEYLFKGPGTYIPRIEESIVNRIGDSRDGFAAIIVLPNHALLLKAKRDTTDVNGTPRKAGAKVELNYLINLVASSQNRVLHANS